MRCHPSVIPHSSGLYSRVYAFGKGRSIVRMPLSVSFSGPRTSLLNISGVRMFSSCAFVPSRNSYYYSPLEASCAFSRWKGYTALHSSFCMFSNAGAAAGDGGDDRAGSGGSGGGSNLKKKKEEMMREGSSFVRSPANKRMNNNTNDNNTKSSSSSTNSRNTSGCSKSAGEKQISSNGGGGGGGGGGHGGVAAVEVMAAIPSPPRPMNNAAATRQTGGGGSGGAYRPKSRSPSLTALSRGHRSVKMLPTRPTIVKQKVMNTENHRHPNNSDRSGTCRGGGGGGHAHQKDRIAECCFSSSSSSASSCNPLPVALSSCGVKELSALQAPTTSFRNPHHSNHHCNVCVVGRKKKRGKLFRYQNKSEYTPASKNVQSVGVRSGGDHDGGTMRHENNSVASNAEGGGKEPEQLTSSLPPDQQDEKKIVKHLVKRKRIRREGVRRRDEEEEAVCTTWTRRNVLDILESQQEQEEAEEEQKAKKNKEKGIQIIHKKEHPLVDSCEVVSSLPSPTLSSSSPTSLEDARHTWEGGWKTIRHKKRLRRRGEPRITLARTAEEVDSTRSTMTAPSQRHHLDKNTGISSSFHSSGMMKNGNERVREEEKEVEERAALGGTRKQESLKTVIPTCSETPVDACSSMVTENGKGQKVVPSCLTSPPATATTSYSSSEATRTSSGRGALSRLRQMRDRYTLITLHHRLKHLAHSLYLRFTEWRQLPNKSVIRSIGEALERAIEENSVEAFTEVCERIQQHLQEEDEKEQKRKPLKEVISSSSTVRSTFRAQLLLLYARALTNFGVYWLLQFDTEKAITLFQHGIRILTVTMTEEEEKVVRASLVIPSYKSTKASPFSSSSAFTSANAMMTMGTPRLSQLEEREKEGKEAITSTRDRRGGSHGEKPENKKRNHFLSPSGRKVACPSLSAEFRTAAITAAVTAISRAPFFSRESSVIYLRILLANALSCEQRYWEAAKEFQLALHQSHMDYSPTAIPVLVQIAPGLRGYQSLSRLFVKEEVASFYRHIRVLEEAISEGHAQQQRWEEGRDGYSAMRTSSSPPHPSSSSSPPVQELEIEHRVGDEQGGAKMNSLRFRPGHAATPLGSSGSTAVGGVGLSPFQEQRETLLTLARVYRHAKRAAKAQECYEAYLQSLVSEGVEDSEYVMLELGRYLLYASPFSVDEPIGVATNAKRNGVHAINKDSTTSTSGDDGSPGIPESTGVTAGHRGTTTSPLPPSPASANETDDQKVNCAEVSVIYLQAGSKLLLEEAWAAFQQHYPALLSLGAIEAHSPAKGNQAPPHSPSISEAALGAKMTINLCARAAGALLDYSHALYVCGKGSKALDVLDRSILWMEKTGLRRHSAWALTHCGDLLCAADQVDKAIIRYSKAMDALKGDPPSSPPLTNNSSRSSNKSTPGGAPSRASSSSSDVASADEFCPQISLNATCVQLHMGEVEGHLGYCFETSVGDYQRAVEHYQNALSDMLALDEEKDGHSLESIAKVDWLDPSYNADKQQEQRFEEEEKEPDEENTRGRVPDGASPSSSSSPYRRQGRRYRRAYGGLPTSTSLPSSFSGGERKGGGKGRKKTSAGSLSGFSFSQDPVTFNSSSSSSLHAALASKSSFSSPVSTKAVLTGDAALIPRITPEGIHWILGRIVACHSILKNWESAVSYQKQVLQVESYVGITQVESSLQLAGLLQKAGNTEQALALYFTLFFLPDEMLTPATRVVVARKFGRCCYRLGCTQMGAVLLRAVKEAQGGADPTTLLELGLSNWKMETSGVPTRGNGEEEDDEKDGSHSSGSLNAAEVEAIRCIFKRAASLVVAYREIDKEEKAGKDRINTKRGSSSAYSPASMAWSESSTNSTEEDELQALTVLNRGAFFFLEIGEEEKALELYSMALRICDEDSSAAIVVSCACHSSGTDGRAHESDAGSPPVVESVPGSIGSSGDITLESSSNSSCSSSPTLPIRWGIRSDAYRQEWSVVLANAAMILAHRQDKKEEALELYRKAAKVCPGSFPVLNAAALFCQSVGLMEDGCFFLKMALQVPLEKVQDEFHFILTQLGETLFTVADAETKYLILERALLSLGVPARELPSASFHPEDSTSNLSCASQKDENSAFHTKKLGNALAIRENNSPSSSLHFITVDNLSQLVDNLGKLLENGMGTTPSPPAASFTCFLLQTHFKEKAALLNRLFRISITRFPENPQLLFNYANFCTAHQFHFFARLYFARSVALQEDCTAAIHGYAAHLQHPTAFGSSHQGGTQELLLRTHAVRQNSWNFYALLLYRQFPSPYKSEAVFERALKEDPNNTTTLSHYAEFLCLSLDSVRASMDMPLRGERLKRIEELLLRCVEVSPEKSTSHYHLGVFYTNCERIPEALASFQQAMARNPTDVDSLRFIASLLKNDCLQSKKAFLLAHQQTPTYSLSSPCTYTSNYSSSCLSSSSHPSGSKHDVSSGDSTASPPSTSVGERARALLIHRFPRALQDQMEQAEDCYEKAVALDPDHVPTLEEYAQFCISGLDNPKRAKELWIRINNIKCLSVRNGGGNREGEKRK